MGQLDDKYLAGKGKGFGSTVDSSMQYKENSSRRKQAMDLISAGVGSITSRDQIINPATLIDPSMYEQTRRGRSQYESDLAALQNFQAQQEAAYQEWYDSPEQAALRERAAGLNPDLIGLDNAGESAEALTSDAVPGQNLPTNDEVAFNAINAITSIASSCASLAGLPLQFAQLTGQKEINKGLQLDNEAKSILNNANLTSNVAGDIEGLLATAVQAHNDSGSTDPFDYDAFFGNDANFEPIKALYKDNPRIDTVLSLQRKQILKHRKNMATLQKDWASNQFDFGQIASDPMFSSDQKLMLATNIPLQAYFFEVRKAALERQRVYDEVDAQIKKGLDVQSAIDAANEQNEYLAALDGRKRAADEEFMRQCNRAALNRKDQIDSNLFSLWSVNPATLEAQGSMYLLGGMQSNNIKDFMLAYSATYMLNSKTIDPKTGLPNTGSALTDWSINPLGVPSTSSVQPFIPPGSVQIP